MMSPQGYLNLKVANVCCEALDVLAIELRSADGGELPAFSAGAHLEIQLPGGLIRHYSLCNDPAERDRYCLGVGLSRDSRGGSRYLHQSLRVGMSLVTSPPRNNFALAVEGQEFAFVAGGIGITPILAMIRSCEARHKPWRLFYCTRNRQRTAFYETLRALAPDRVHFHFDDEQGGRLFDAAQMLDGVSQDAHIYCCGPAPLMKAVEGATTAGRRPDHVHFEWFTAAAVDCSTDRAFSVLLRSSGKRLVVPPGRSILEVLEDNDECVPYSCREGLCATCCTPVLSGIPDHRDSVLSAPERAANNQMMICVSRSKTDVIELDL